jgi:hypothetical protein
MEADHVHAGHPIKPYEVRPFDVIGHFRQLGIRAIDGGQWLHLKDAVAVLNRGQPGRRESVQALKNYDCVRKHGETYTHIEHVIKAAEDCEDGELQYAFVLGFAGYLSNETRAAIAYRHAKSCGHPWSAHEVDRQAFRIGDRLWDEDGAKLAVFVASNPDAYAEGGERIAEDREEAERVFFQELAGLRRAIEVTGLPRELLLPAMEEAGFRGPLTETEVGN